MRGRRASDDFVSLVYKIFDSLAPEITFEELAQKVLSNRGTVWRIIKRRIGGTLRQRKIDLGPPRVTSTQQDDAICRDVQRNSQKTIRLHSQFYGLSKSTLQRRVRNAGFLYRRASPKFPNDHSERKTDPFC